MKRKKLCNVFIATGFLAVLLTACSINNETAKEPELTLEDWVQPGWMIDTLASREEYAVKFVDCWKSKGVTGARIDFGRPWISYYSSGDLDLDKPQGEINNVAMTACSEQLQQPLAKFSKESAEHEYEKCLDPYQLIFAMSSPYRIDDSKTVMNIQSECIGADWFSYGVSG